MTGPYAVDDEVIVTGDGTWHGHQTRGHTGTVVGVAGEDAPRPLYNVDLDGSGLPPVPLTADEIAGRGPGRERTVNQEEDGTRTGG